VRATPLGLAGLFEEVRTAFVGCAAVPAPGRPTDVCAPGWLGGPGADPRLPRPLFVGTPARPQLRSRLEPRGRRARRPDLRRRSLGPAHRLRPPRHCPASVADAGSRPRERARGACSLDRRPSPGAYARKLPQVAGGGLSGADAAKKDPRYRRISALAPVSKATDAARPKGSAIPPVSPVRSNAPALKPHRPGRGAVPTRTGAIPSPGASGGASPRAPASSRLLTARVRPPLPGSSASKGSSPAPAHPTGAAPYARITISEQQLRAARPFVHRQVFWLGSAQGRSSTGRFKGARAGGVQRFKINPPRTWRNRRPMGRPYEGAVGCDMIDRTPRRGSRHGRLVQGERQAIFAPLSRC